MFSFIYATSLPCYSKSEVNRSHLTASDLLLDFSLPLPLKSTLLHPSNQPLSKHGLPGFRLGIRQVASWLEKAGSSQMSFKVSLTQGAGAWLTLVEFICSFVGFLAFPDVCFGDSEGRRGWKHDLLYVVHVVPWDNALFCCLETLEVRSGCCASSRTPCPSGRAIMGRESKGKGSRLLGGRKH